jgi:MFS family permease
MEGPVKPWEVLAERNFGLFWSSALIAAIGNQISSVTIAWQVYVMTDSPLQLGLTGLFFGLPIIIFSLTGGVLADRMSRRKLLIVTQGGAMILALLLGLLTTTGLVKVWHIYLITFLTGAVATFDQPARVALIPSLVRRDHLATAFALNVTLRQTATLVGPFLAGIIIASLGISSAYYINAMSFMAVIVFLAVTKVQETWNESKKESALRSLREGIHFMRRNSGILALLVLDTCVNLFGAYKSMMPVFARDLLNVGPQGLGVLLGAPAIGALVGSSAVILMKNPQRKGQMVIAVTLIYSVALILFAVSRSFIFSLAVAFVLGALDSVGETLRMTIVQLMTPDHLRGRVQGLVHVFVAGSPFLGQAQLGAAAAVLSVPGAVIMGGLVGVAAVGAMAKRLAKL